MKNGKKAKVLAAVLSAALFVMPLAGCTQDGGAEGDTIKIGALAPLTGDVSQYGVAVNNALKMAVEEINANGGVLGKQIDYMVEDEKGDVTEAMNAYNKLVGQGVVAIVGDVTSAPSKAVAQRANDDGMPIITASGTDAEITQTGKYAYRTCFIDPYQGKLMATYASKELGAKSVAVLYDSGDSYSTGIADAFEETARELGMTVTNKEGYAHGSTDFNAQLTKIKAGNPDVVMLPVYYQDVVLILRQAQQQGLGCQFLGADGWDGVVPQLDGDSSLNDLLAKSYFCSQYSASSDDPKLQSFLTTYKEKYNLDATMFAVLGYDTMYILADAIERAGSTDADAIIQALSETEYAGLTGTTTFDEDRNPVRESVITTFENGNYKVLETYQA